MRAAQCVLPAHRRCPTATPGKATIVMPVDWSQIPHSALSSKRHVLRIQSDGEAAFIIIRDAPYSDVDVGHDAAGR